MTAPPATVLVVFGRGVIRSGSEFVLTPASAARVDAALAYATRHQKAFERAPARIIFSGGWAEACEGAPEPPEGCCEGDLMLARARAGGVGAWVQLRAEIRSRSTLENLLHVAGEGLLADLPPPIGLVSHGWHLPRVRYLAGKVLGLHGAALVNVPVAGGGGHGERIAYAMTRVFLFGVREPGTLLHRERRMVAGLRRAERVLRRRRRAPIAAEMLDQVSSTRAALDGKA
ncbi:YdcF family protein [Actinoplanes sp. NPDC051859]|uniref:YdcF family protein n=1 Tax=Actinoplanes sp. NPDC051859 TaxID=3363909 RepID=UPI0037B8A986